ncbi:MAG: VacJ family lipoprotein [Syntrophobacteraceae bacterium]
MKSQKYSQFWVLAFFVFFIFVCAPGMISPYLDNRAHAAIAESFETDESVPVAISDPYEPFNRSMFNLNDKIYFFVIKPVGTVYAAYFPPGFRGAIRNGFHNAFFPVRFINCLLQNKGDKAGTEVARFAINTTLGIGGLFDPAKTEFRIEKHEEDFGQTLAVWGAGTGSYWVVPVIGPTNTRDLVGYIVDHAMDPLVWVPAEWYVSASVSAGKLFNNASLRIGQYEDFKKAAIDPYVSLRSAYQQYRVKEIAK